MVYQENVDCFIEVMKNQSALFTETNWIELAEIADEIPEEDDDEEIWQKISDWLKLHPNVKAVHETYLDNEPPLEVEDEYLGFGGSKPEESSDKPTSDPTLLEKLKNEIHRHKDLDSSKQSTS
jgi:hypothetical protein